MPTFEEMLARKTLDIVLLETQAAGIVNLIQYTPYTEEGFYEALLIKKSLQEQYNRLVLDHSARYGAVHSSTSSYESFISLVKAYNGGDCVGLAYLAFDYLRCNGAFFPRMVNFFLSGDGIAHSCVAFNSKALITGTKVYEKDLFALDQEEQKRIMIVDPWLNFFCYADQYFFKMNEILENQPLYSFSGDYHGRVLPKIKDYSMILLVDPLLDAGKAAGGSELLRQSRKRTHSQRLSSSEKKSK